MSMAIKRAGMFAALLAAFGGDSTSGANRGGFSQGRKRSPEMREAKNAERARWRDVLMARAEAKRERKRRRNLGQ